MTCRLTVTNQKGGVGKTTIAINLAGALADRGHDVLFVDLDAQGNATVGLGLEEQYVADGLSLYDVLVDIDKQHRINELLHSHSEFDVLPSHIEMFTIVGELATAMRGRERLWLALNDLDAEYDYLIIDSSPSIGPLTDNALLACRNILIPVLAEATSQHAVDILFDHLNTLEDSYGVSISPIGLVVNRIEVDGEADRVLEWFHDQFGESLPIWKIRNRVALKRAWANGVSIFNHNETTDMDTRFHDIASQLEEI